MELKQLKLTKRRIELLNKMDIYSVEQLLQTYPYRYESVQAVPFSQWNEGETVAFEGLICKQANVVRFGKNRSMTKFRVITWNEEVEITLFNRPWSQQFTFGKVITIFGQYQGKNKVVASNYNFKPLVQQQGFHPVYTLTEGLKQNEMRSIVEMALEHVDIVEDLVPLRYQTKYKLMPIREAIQKVHKPATLQDVKMAIRTLKYKEFLCFQCVMQATQNRKLQTEFKEPKQFDYSLIEEWMTALPYELTEDQQKGIKDVCDDMRSSKMMFRLVQGDVGCGKTMVAIASLYACHLSGWQSVLLAPTEILAHQHYENLLKQNLPVTFYVSSLPAKEKKKIMEDLESGQASIVVGTHALFQEQVHFKNLGLAIVDEQQRFGVRQRRALLEKGKNIDFLMLSATPIPRTYAHFIYGDMDITNIKQMPKGRQSVYTKYVSGSSMAPVLPEILEAIEQKRQCYVVCPAIEDGTIQGLRSATSIYEGMKKTLKDKVRIGLLHGKMKSEEKEAVMAAFSSHELDILVSTTVIEVGIDVKNATYMVIYDAHRFGLSTLHQLRGRCARSSEQGHCYLLSPSQDPEAIKRLKMLEKLTNGFEITEYDLQTRGPGDILGVRQSGLPNFVLGDLEKDKVMMEYCIQDAKEVLQLKEDTPLLDFVHKAVEKVEYFD